MLAVSAVPSTAPLTKVEPWREAMLTGTLSARGIISVARVYPFT